MGGRAEARRPAPREPGQHGENRDREDCRSRQGAGTDARHTGTLAAACRSTFPRRRSRGPGSPDGDSAVTAD